LSFGAFKEHCSLFPATDIRAAAPEEMKSFKGGKGTLRFTIEKQIPDDLLEKIVKLRVESTRRK
jgi:uncharacterized protein YdhG (YjbR/CyaY superfamily)